jgi:hypothetical protein
MPSQKIAERLHSLQPTGRSNDWVKKTCARRETLTIAGFALDGTKWDGLFVGRRKGKDLVSAGKVDRSRPPTCGSAWSFGLDGRESYRKLRLVPLCCPHRQSRGTVPYEREHPRRMCRF